MTFAGGFPKPTPRKAPLKPGQQRRSWMRAKRPRRLDTAQSNPLRLEWTHYQECIGVGRLLGHVCRGQIEAAHEGRKPGVAMKCPDDQTVPMDSELHRHWTNHTGPFKGWSKQQRRDWMDPIIDEVHARFLSAGNRRTG